MRSTATADSRDAAYAAVPPLPPNQEQMRVAQTTATRRAYSATSRVRSYNQCRCCGRGTTSGMRQLQQQHILLGDKNKAAAAAARDSEGKSGIPTNDNAKAAFRRSTSSDDDAQRRTSHIPLINNAGRARTWNDEMQAAYRRRASGIPSIRAIRIPSNDEAQPHAVLRWRQRPALVLST